jgi:putative two-component system response regulator
MTSQRDGESGFGRLVLVGAGGPVTLALEPLLVQTGCDIHATVNSAGTFQAIATYRPDLVVVDATVDDDFSLCRQLKGERETRLLPVILVTPRDSSAARVAGAHLGVDAVLSLPLDPEEFIGRVGASIRLKRYTDDLDSTSAVVAMLGSMIDAREGYGPRHAHRVGNQAAALGRMLSLPSADIHTLRRGGFLHDIGMLAMPGHLVNRQGPLSQNEFELIKSHTIIGDNLCGQLPTLSGVRAIVRHHHERLDGSGYPDGLSGDAVPLLAQIVGIVDCYEALTGGRPYQPARDPDAAIAVLRDHVRRGWYRAELVDPYVTMLQTGLPAPAVATADLPGRGVAEAPHGGQRIGRRGEGLAGTPR